MSDVVSVVFDPGKPLEDPTDDALGRAVADNLFALFRAMAVLPGAEVEEGPVFGRHHAFPNNPMFRGVWRLRAGEEMGAGSAAGAALDGAIAESVAWFARRESPFFFWWVDAHSPPDIHERLEARGFAPWEMDAPGMVAELDALRFDLQRRVPAGYVTERVRDDAGLLAFRDAFVESFGVPEWAGQAWVDATQAVGIERAPWRAYVGRLDGRAVASNLLFLGAGVASVFGVGTVAEARGRGIGSAITLAAYEDARELGFRHGVLFGTEAGVPVYRRIGFRPAGVGISRYLWRAGG